MDEDLGFGAVEACQEAIGIRCEECKYFMVCVGEHLAEDIFNRRS